MKHSKNALKRSLNPSKMDYSDRRKTSTKSAKSLKKSASMGVAPLRQTHLFITGLPDLSAPVLRSDSHTDRPSCRQKLDSAPGTETPTKRSGVGLAYRDLQQKEFLWRWPIFMVLRAEEGDGQEYLVTRINDCY